MLLVPRLLFPSSFFSLNSILFYSLGQVCQLLFGFLWNECVSFKFSSLFSCSTLCFTCSFCIVAALTLLRNQPFYCSFYSISNVHKSPIRIRLLLFTLKPILIWFIRCCRRRRRCRCRHYRMHMNVVVDGYIDGVLSSTDWNEGRKKYVDDACECSFLIKIFINIYSESNWIFADILEFTNYFRSLRSFEKLTKTYYEPVNRHTKRLHQWQEK